MAGITIAELLESSGRDDQEFGCHAARPAGECEVFVWADEIDETELIMDVEREFRETADSILESLNLAHLRVPHPSH